MKHKYTKKQIQESINYWQKQLDHMDAIDIIECAIKKYDNSVISESIKTSIIDKVKSDINSKIKDENDIKQFVDNNDDIVKNTKSSALQKSWNIIKKVLTTGKNGIKFILKNWKWILIIIAAVLIAKYGFWGTIGKMIAKSLDIAAKWLAKGFEALVGKKYIDAGVKLDNANIASGGYGGWNMAGLGGGLR